MISQKAAYFSTVMVGVLLLAGMALAMYKFSYDTTHTVVRVGNGRFVVEVANTASEREEGLQGRSTLDDDKGMLFVFPNRGQHQFWMKNTEIPLDIIWIEGNRVIDIAKNVQPAQEGTPNYQIPTYTSEEPASMALEVNAGSVDAYRIEIGDDVIISDTVE